MGEPQKKVVFNTDVQLNKGQNIVIVSFTQ